MLSFMNVQSWGCMRSVVKTSYCLVNWGSWDIFSNLILCDLKSIRYDFIVTWLLWNLTSSSEIVLYKYMSIFERMPSLMNVQFEAVRDLVVKTSYHLVNGCPEVKLTWKATQFSARKWPENMVAWNVRWWCQENERNILASVCSAAKTSFLF